MPPADAIVPAVVRDGTWLARAFRKCVPGVHEAERQRVWDALLLAARMDRECPDRPDGSRNSAAGEETRDAA